MNVQKFRHILIRMELDKYSGVFKVTDFESKSQIWKFKIAVQKWWTENPKSDLICISLDTW